MNKLNDFMQILTGHFNNAQQYEAKKGENFPYAEHVNTACNDKIRNLPADFAGVFMVEESYFTANGSTHAAPHLFLFTEQDGGVLEETMQALYPRTSGRRISQTSPMENSTESSDDASETSAQTTASDASEAPRRRRSNRHYDD